MSVPEAKVSAPAPHPSPPANAGGAPARSRAETRRRLMEAAVELFASEGLRGVTSARIARRAGVASGTFYLHFPDKKALFRELAFAALEELRARQARAGAGAPDAAAELRARTEELLRFAEEQRSLVRMLFGREGDEVGDEVLDHVVAGIEARLRERIAAGEVAGSLNPAAAAQAVAGMTARVVAWWVEDPSRAPREQVIETILRMHPTLAGRSGD